MTSRLFGQILGRVERLAGAAEVRTPLLANIGFDWWNAVEQRFTKV